MKKTNKLLLIILFCKSVHPTDHLITVDQMVDFVSEKLIEKSLTFNSCIPKEFYSLFQQGALKAQEILSQKDKNRLPHLSKLKEKAHNLYAHKDLTSSWLLYLHLICAELLSFDNSSNEKDFSYITLGGKDMEEGFEKFTSLHEHRQTLKEEFTRSLIPNHKKEEKALVDKNKNLSFEHFQKLEWLVVRRDCFWLPILTENPHFPISTLNKAYVHRIGLIGIPFENADYDGYLKKPPSDFAAHEIDHARIFDTQSLSIVSQKIKVPSFDFLDLPNDPWIRFWHQLWKTIDALPLSQYVFFDMLHENAQSRPFRDYQFFMKKLDLKEAIQISLTQNKRYNSDFTTPESYWRSILKNAAITDVTTIDTPKISSHTLEETYTILYGTPSQAELMIFTNNSNYALDKEVSKNMASYLIQLGVPLESKAANLTPQTGETFYLFLEKAYESFSQTYGKL